MRSTSSKYVFSLCATLLVLVVTGVSESSARSIRVDVGSGQYATNGQAWQNSETPLLGAAVLPGALPFAINFGTGPQTGFCLSGNGTIGFSANCGAVPANAVLQPLANDWITDDSAGRIFDPGSVTFTQGHLARDQPFPDNPDDAPLAVRFHWSIVGCDACGGATYSFQAILIDMGNGDFDLELNYDDIPAGLGIASFLLGTNLYPAFAGPFSSGENYDFRFRNGVLVDGTSVPEPTVVWLLAVAMLAMAFAGRRRRVSKR